MGFGMGNFNDVLLEQLADDGNGTYAYIDNLEEAERLFVDELASTLQTIALDAKIQVEFDPSTVSLYRLVGYENRGVADEDFRNDEVEAGEIGAGHSVTALYALQLRPGAQGQLGRVTLRWQDPDDHRALEIFEDFGVWSLARDYNQTDPHFQLAAVTAQYAELLRKSPWAGPGTLESLIPYAYQAAAQLVFNPDAGELATLISRANELRP
jgi:Ca-activated chloride channel family protein